MNKEVPNRIRLILNELAILNQPEVSNGIFFYQMEVLDRIKVLCSELYLLSDLAKSPTAENSVSSNADKTPQKESMPAEPVIESTLIEQTFTEIGTTERNTPEANNITPIVETKVVEIENENPVDVPISVEGQTSSNPKPVKSNELINEISLTRRFEYANNLFSGNQVEFLEFVDAVSSCSNLESALNFFDKHSAANNWKRKEESASDFRSLVKKWY